MIWGAGASALEHVAGAPALPSLAFYRSLFLAARGVSFFLVVFLFSTGCGAFDDPTPESIVFEVRGEAGRKVRVIYSKHFVAGVGDLGVTRVQVFRPDSVLHVIPFDTIIDISVEKRWFVQAEAMEGDTLSVAVVVDVDDRNLLNETGGIFPDVPWHFVYAFNHRYTRTLDVEF